MIGIRSNYHQTVRVKKTVGIEKLLLGTIRQLFTLSSHAQFRQSFNTL